MPVKKFKIKTSIKKKLNSFPSIININLTDNNSKNNEPIISNINNNVKSLKSINQ